MKNWKLVLGLCLTACTDRPPREKFPGPQGQTTDATRAQSAKEVMGGTDSFSAKLEQDALKASEISGQVLVEGTSKLPAKYFLFISARRLTGGPPLAVKREKLATFPYSFRLNQNDVMIPGVILEGLVEVTARIDQDGDPLSRNPGDYVGTVQAKVGQKNLVIKMETIAD